MKRTPYHALLQALAGTPRTWLVTGAAGFIGSHLVETLLRCGQKVVGLDNFSTGHARNLDEVRSLLPASARRRFRFLEADLTDERACRRATRNVDFVLHQAALGSVPRSIDRPLDTHSSNVTGFIHILVAARTAGVKRFVYASSSSVYGDHADLPKQEAVIGEPLSPYAASKWMNEIYAGVFARCYGLPTIGLRYFNVFGPRQDPAGPYAAVIPKWINALLRNQPVHIHGDGQTTRDFCYVANAVQANLLAATTARHGALNQIYNVALHQRTSLIELFELIRRLLATHHPQIAQTKPVYSPFRKGDIRHSEADISKARRFLGYQPTHPLEHGLAEALSWYESHPAPV
jgi:UDP-N-acetylglucosamine/UDP-N-acetylgalactosamine 4-epimerase